MASAAFAPIKTGPPPTCLDARRLPSPSTGLSLWLLDATDFEPRAFEPLLSADERSRADRFRLPTLRDRYIVAHGSLRQLLRDLYGIGIAAQSLDKNAFDKPRLTHYPSLHFNMSYSGRYALLGICEQDEIGVDIEVPRIIEDAAELMDTHFTPAEQAAVVKAGDGLDTAFSAAFLKVWVRKEACVKAFGCGLNIPLNEMECGNDDRVTTVRLGASMCETGFTQAPGAPFMAWARRIKTDRVT